jgi:hypothetical protein
MMKPLETKFSKSLVQAMKDYGYEYQGTTLIRKAVKGFMPAHVMGKFNSAFAAAEHLIPIIRDDEYTNRVNPPIKA